MVRPRKAAHKHHPPAPCVPVGGSGCLDPAHSRRCGGGASRKVPSGWAPHQRTPCLPPVASPSCTQTGQSAATPVSLKPMASSFPRHCATLPVALRRMRRGLCGINQCCTAPCMLRTPGSTQRPCPPPSRARCCAHVSWVHDIRRVMRPGCWTLRKLNTMPAGSESADPRCDSTLS